jgi:hypothetical protein
MASIIIAINQTAGALPLGTLSIPDHIIPAGTFPEVTLTDFATVSEIQENAELEAYIIAGDVILNDGTNDLTTSEALGLLDANASTASFNNFSATTAPGTGNDETEGYAIGSIWIDTATNTTYMLCGPLLLQDQLEKPAEQAELDKLVTQEPKDRPARQAKQAELDKLVMQGPKVRPVGQDKPARLAEQGKPETQEPKETPAGPAKQVTPEPKETQAEQDKLAIQGPKVRPAGQDKQVTLEPKAIRATPDKLALARQAELVEPAGREKQAGPEKQAQQELLVVLPEPPLMFLMESAPPMGIQEMV